MIKHVIIWKLKDSIEDKEKVKHDIKANLESLNTKIDGMLSLRVITEHLDSSTGDLMLDSTFDCPASLKAYSINPLHQQIANEYVRPNVEVRLSYDYNS